MEFTQILACLLAVVSHCLCDTNFGWGSRGSSYTGGLVGGIGRQAGLGTIGAVGSLGCNCPLGTICDVNTGSCIAQSVGLASPIGVGGAIGVGGPFGVSGPIGVGGAIGLGGALDGADEFGNPVIIGSGLGKGVVGGGVVGGSGYGNGGLGFSRCGYMSRACRASAFDRFPKCKYTFSHRLQRCVKVNVCKSCRFANGPDANLFDTMYDCQRICH